jgi:hypothetical protein
MRMYEFEQIDLQLSDAALQGCECEAGICMAGDRVIPHLACHLKSSKAERSFTATT